MIDRIGRISKVEERQRDSFGPSVMGFSITDFLFVSPDGDGTNGRSWRTAYQTIPDALDAASMDAADLTLIQLAPHPTFYDIDTAGDPTWAANVVLCGSINGFTIIMNSNVGATSILKLTGKSAVYNALLDLGTGNNGLILTRDGSEIKHIRFNGASLTGAATALHLDGVTGLHARVEDVEFHGHVSHMTGLMVDQFAFSNFRRLHFITCLTGLHVVGADSDENDYVDLDFGECALGMDLDAGNTQHFKDVIFENNTRNVDDEVGDHTWVNIFGLFDIEILPDDLVGATVATGGAGAYGADTEILSAASRDNPFRIVGVNFAPDASPAEWYQVRFTDDSGASFYDILQFISDKREGAAAPPGTEHIFNAGTRISCSARDISGGDNVQVWVEVQEI